MRGTDAAVLLVAYCAAMAAGALTIVPAGLGVVDGALVLGIVAAGAGSAAAIATVVLYRVVALGIVGERRLAGVARPAARARKGAVPTAEGR